MPRTKAPPTYQLRVQVRGLGTTWPSPGEHDILAGMQLAVKAYPRHGWHFRSWSVPGAPTTFGSRPENPLVWTMEEPVELIAIFDEDRQQ